jgi:hypothetical protein
MRSTEKYGPTREANLFKEDGKARRAIKRGSEMLRQALIREHPARIAGLQRNQQKDRRE